MKINRLLTQATALVMLAVTGCVIAPAFAQENPPGFVQRQGANIITQNLVPTGAATTGSALEIVTNGASALGVEVSGTYTGALSLQGTIGGVTWETVGGTPFTKRSTAATSATIASGATGNYVVNVAGYYKVRITGLSAMSGAATVNVIGSVSDGSSIAAGGSSSGGLTDTELRATPVPISGTVTATGPLTDAQLRAAVVPISGTVTASGPLTDAQLRASRVNVNAAVDDGNNVALGAIADARATPGSTGTGSAKLRTLTEPVAPATPGSATATSAYLSGGTYNSTPPTWTNTQQGSLQVDAAGNLRTTHPDTSSFTGTCSSSCLNTTLVAWTTDGYASAELQVTSAGTGATFAWQCSSDNVTFITCEGISAGATGSSGVASPSTGAVGQFCIPVWSRYQRIQMTGYTSGTVTVQGYQRAKPNCPAMAANVNVQSTVSTSTFGNTAQGATTSTQPVITGTEARTTTGTAVTSGQSVRMVGSTDGKLVVLPRAVPELTWTYAAAASGILNTTTAVTIKTAGTDRLYLESVDLMCETLGAATEVVIRDGAGGTVLWRQKVGTGGQSLVSIPMIPPRRGTSATLMEVATLTASITGACYVNAGGFDAK